MAPGLLLRRRLRLQPRLLVISLQSLHLLEAILGRVVPVAPPGQRLHGAQELSRQALIDQAVGLQRRGGTSRSARWILAISTYSEAITKSWAGRMERLEKSSVA